MYICIEKYKYLFFKYNGNIKGQAYLSKEKHEAEEKDNRVFRERGFLLYPPNSSSAAFYKQLGKTWPLLHQIHSSNTICTNT